MEHLSQNPQELSSYYGPMLGNQTEFVRNFAAKTFVLVFKKLKTSTFVKHMKKLMRALASNMRAACDNDIEKISYLEKPEEGTGIVEEKRSKWLLHGVSRLLHSTFRGIKGEMHSKAIDKIQQLLLLFSSQAKVTENDNLDDVFYLKALGCVLHRCLFLMHLHLSKENQAPLVNAEMSFLSDCVGGEESSSPCRIVLEFTPKVLLTVLTVNHGKALSDASTRKSVIPVATEITCTLFSILYPTSRGEERQEVQQLFVSAWLMNPTGKLLRQTFSAVLLRSEHHGADEEARLVDFATSLKALPKTQFFTDVLPVLAEYFAVSMRTSSEQMLDNLVAVLFAIYDYRENSDTFATEQGHATSFLALSQMHENFAVAPWQEIISSVLKDLRVLGKKKSTKASDAQDSFVSKLRLISWLVNVLSSAQLQSLVNDIKTILEHVVKLLSVSTTATLAMEEKGLLLSDYTLFVVSEILVGLHSLHASLRNEHLIKLITDTFQVAMARPHSLYQSQSLRSLLQHHPEQDSHLLSSLFEEDGVAAYVEQTAGILAHCSFWERLNLLHILTFITPPTLGSSFQGEDYQAEKSSSASEVDIAGLMLEIITLPINLKTERDIVRRFETLEVLCRGSKLPKHFVTLIAGFCLGMFRAKFRPIWSAAAQALVTISHQEGGEEILWPFLQRTLDVFGLVQQNSQDTTQIPVSDHLYETVSRFVVQENDQDELVAVVRNTPYFAFQIGEGTKALPVAPDAVADPETTFLQLLEFLAKAPNVTMKRSKVVVAIFFHFLQAYYSVFTTDIEIPLLQSIGLLEGDLATISTSLSRKSLRARLMGFLKVFAAITGPKQLHKHHLLYAYYHELLSKSDKEISKVAFDCICTYKPAHVAPYKDHLKVLLEDNKFRNEMLAISASLENKEETILADEHRNATFLLIIRILYGVLLARSGSSRKEKDLQRSRRVAIFSFVVQLGPEAAKFLTFMMLRGLLPTRLLRVLPSDFLDQHTSLLDMKLVDDYLTSFHGHILQTLDASRDLDFQEASWDRLKGYLYSLEPAISNIGFVLTPMLPLLYKTLLSTLNLCQSVKINDGHDGDLEVDGIDTDAAADEENDADEVPVEDVGRDMGRVVELKVSSECRTLVLKRIAEMVEQYHRVFDFTVQQDLLVSGLQPLLKSLYSALYSSPKPPAILVLLHKLAQHPNMAALFIEYHADFIDNCIACLSIQKLNVDSARLLINIFSRLMDLDNGQCLVPYAERIVNMFVQRLRANNDSEDMSMLKLSDVVITSLGGIREEVDLLCRIATDIFSSDDVVISSDLATNFATIILGILRTYTTSNKTRISEDWVINMLIIYRSFVRRMDNVTSHCSFFSRTFGPTAFAGSKLNLSSVRRELIITYGLIAEHASVKKTVHLSYIVLSNLMKQDSGLLESKDYGSFVPYMQALANPKGATIAGEHVSWDDVMGPAAYKRQGKANGKNATKRSISEHVSITSAVLFEIIRALYDPEMAIRSSATIAVKALITDASNWVDLHDDWVCIFTSFLTPAIRKGVQQSSDLIKTDFLGLLAHFVGVASRNEANGHKFCEHIDLAFLLNDDKDQDFFHNISHIQVHRRARAFLKLHRLLRDETQNRDFSVPTYVHLLIPLAMYYINSEEFNKKLHANLLEEITQLIGAICSKLPWNHYLNTFRKIVRVLQKADETRTKLLQSILCVILDNFHFPLVSAETIIGEQEEEALDEDGEDEEGDEVTAPATEKVVESGETEEAAAEVALPTASQKGSVVSVVINYIMPTVKQFLLKSVKDHKGNKTEQVQPNIAVALTNLLLHLQPPVVSHDERMTLFSSLVMKIVNTLKSRDSDIRDAARHCLAKMISILGMGALRAVVFELHSNLREGFQRHVAAYSLRSILVNVMEDYTAPDPATLEEYSSSSSDVNVDVQDILGIIAHRVVKPDFDQAIDLIMGFVLEDLSTDMKDDRDSEGAVRSTIKEMKGSKFAELLETTSRCLLFRPTFALQAPTNPSSVSSIHAVSMPLLEALQNAEDGQFSGRIGEALTRVATGLAKNASIVDKELLLYVHATLQPFVAQMLAEYRRYRDALGKLQVNKKQKQLQQSNGALSDDSDFEIDLPSYLRAADEDNGGEEDEGVFDFMKKKRRRDAEDTIDQQKAPAWLPTDARSLKTQRAVIEERNQMQKEQFRTQDGASAPKLTGRNRYDLAHRRGKNAAGISKVTLIAIKFCLTLMLSTLKRGIFQAQNVDIQSMMLPFLPLLRSFLHIPNASEVVALSIKLIGALVSWGVSLDSRTNQRLANRILMIMIRNCAAISAESELCQACVRSLVSMIRHFNEKMAQHEQRAAEISKAGGNDPALPPLERPDFPLNEVKLRSLVEMLTLSITEITSSFQNPAFQLIKEIIRSKVLVPEIYDLIKKLTDQIVLSHRQSIRETSSQIVITFMITYPMGNKRSESQLVQLLNNCNYEYEEGRSSALETIYHILRSFPVPVIEEHAYRFFFPMTLKLTNETSPVCRDWVVQVLSVLLRRLASNDLQQQLLDFGVKWLGTVVQTQDTHSWTEENLAVLRTGAQVMGVFFRTRPDLLTKSGGETAKQIVQTVYETLILLRGAEDAEEAALRSEQHSASILLPRHWHSVYHLLLLIEQIMVSGGASADHWLCHVTVAAGQASLLETIADSLLYRHVWVRSVAARLLLAYFQHRPPRNKRLTLYMDAQSRDLFQTPNVLYQLARKMCILLNQAQMPATLLTAVAQGLSYVTQAFVFHPELDTFAPEEEDEKDEVSDVAADEEEDREVEDEDDEDDKPEDRELTLLEQIEAENEQEDNDINDPDAAYQLPEEGQVAVEVEHFKARAEDTAVLPSAMIPGATIAQKSAVPASGSKKRAAGTAAVSVSQRRGLTWLMQRLRAIGADIRGQRRFHVLHVLQALLASRVLSVDDDLLPAYAEQLAEPAVRVMLAANSIAQTMGFDNAPQQTEEQLALASLAKDVLQEMEDQLTPTVYLEVFTSVQNKLQRIQTKKRQARRTLAVSNPALYNKMRIDKNLRKKSGIKRKIQGYQAKRGVFKKQRKV